MPLEVARVSPLRGQVKEPPVKPTCDLCMVGAFPPPVHGMALLNDAMYEHICDRGNFPLRLDLAPASLARTWFNRLGRIPKIAKMFSKYVRKILSKSSCTLYVGLSGGWGQAYEVCFVAVARFRGARLFLHHHSFAYLDRKKLITALLVRVAGPTAVHVVGCDGQGQKLRQRYPVVRLTRVASNAAIMWRSAGTRHRTRTAVRRVGYFGNISNEKGITECLAVADQLRREGSDLNVCVAGPFENTLVEDVVREAVRLKTIEYLGPRYGSEKEAFWESIDVLLFPSRYSNETAPLVVYEAIAHGVPVVAWERGCLSDMVPPNAGVLVRKEQDFVAVAVPQLLAWQHDPVAFSETSNAAQREFLRQRERHLAELEGLLDELCSAFPAHSSPGKPDVSRAL